MLRPGFLEHNKQERNCSVQSQSHVTYSATACQDGGVLQGSCSLIYASRGCITLPECAPMTESHSALTVIEPTGYQLRVLPNQRAGLNYLVRKYNTCALPGSRDPSLHRSALVTHSECRPGDGRGCTSAQTPPPKCVPTGSRQCDSAFILERPSSQKDARNPANCASASSPACCASAGSNHSSAVPLGKVARIASRLARMRLASTLRWGNAPAKARALPWVDITSPGHSASSAC